MNKLTTEENERMIAIIDLAVDDWHEIAHEHGFKTCNCFREKFVNHLIERGLFDGYLYQEREEPER